jgi:hypothetical protein
LFSSSDEEPPATLEAETPDLQPQPASLADDSASSAQDDLSSLFALTEPDDTTPAADTAEARAC